MKFSAAAILALGSSPAHSFSYLNSLNSPSSPQPQRDEFSSDPIEPNAPFFFTNGAQDDLADDAPAFFFTNDSSDDEPAFEAIPPPMVGGPVETAQSNGNYLSALGDGASSISGAGMASYLDSIPQSPPTFGGAGMPSYTDSISGAGVPSYAASVDSGAGFEAPYEPPASYEPATPPAPVAPVETAGSNGNYLSALGGGASSISGPGMASYTDALPQNSAISGSGMASYTASLNGDSGFAASYEAPYEAAAPAAPAASVETAGSNGNYLSALGGGASSVSGPGMASYTDSLPQNSAISGSGMASYTASLNGAAGFAAQPPPPPPPPPAAPAAPVETAGSNGNYLSALGGGASSISGPGMASYTDSLPQNSAISGSGMASYTASLNGAAGFVPPPPPPPPVASEAPRVPAAPVTGPTAPTTGSYLESLPTETAVSGGAGIGGYLSTLPTSNVAGGPGMASYTDALGGGSPSAPATGSSPFGTNAPAPAFTNRESSGSFELNFDGADVDMLEEKLAASGDRSVILKGRISRID